MQKLEVKQYLDILELQEEPPSFAYLSKLVQAHVYRFPFENIGKLLNNHNQSFGRRAIPTLSEFVSQFNDYQFGGTCYVLNTVLKQLLKELGFTCYNIHLGDEHLALIVHLNGETLFVDCGVAAPIFEPVRIEKEDTHIFTYHAETIIIKRLDDTTFEFARYIKGNLTEDCWSFTPYKPTSKAFINKMLLQSHKLTATYMSELRCQLWKPDKNMRIRNNQLRVYYPDGTTEKHEFKTVDEIEHCIHNEFGFTKLPVKQAVRILNELGVDIFEKKQAVIKSVEKS
ncbi:arylamine N-acetyltransferase [Alkalicoccobacillus murimartini]|uniref:Arylamine N-acetyltransferase n=1 Tax=Alkalicoccobacillus murimartini TaxID=171685 RepID=A0ABT9YK01_9BACI|nr:arylamine N-acetyltransferase [Alkalicoccobacillus murimartini]MDQ0208189.1 arylamine N-acetyltransferase [Alkalicoccobacillus murimartini]